MSEGTPAAQATTETPATTPTTESLLYDKTPSAKAAPAPEVKADGKAVTETPAAATPPPAEKTVVETKSDQTPPPEKTKEDAVTPKEGEKTETIEGKAPVELKLTIPKESLLSVEQVEGLKAYAKEKALSSEQAQELLVRESAAVDTFRKNQQEVLKTKAVEWISAAEKDSEIGGEKFAENVANAKRALDKFGSGALRAELDKTGFGNHPELIRVFSRIGKEMANDKLIRTGVSATPRERTAEEIFYGETTK